MQWARRVCDVQSRLPSLLLVLRLRETPSIETLYSGTDGRWRRWQAVVLIVVILLQEGELRMRSRSTWKFSRAHRLLSPTGSRAVTGQNVLFNRR
jgi:hypothetical protein